jgi:MarR family transcriptional regulator, organic hydroperoxide resistance regulator
MQAQPTPDAVEPAARASAAAPDAELLVFAEAMDEFLRAARRARGQLNRTPVVPELSASQFHLLEPLLSSPEALCVGALADAAGVTPPSATRMLDGLQERGLVARVRTSDDRRIVRVQITPEGAELVARKQGAMRATRKAVFNQLTPGERRTAARVLHRLAAAIEDLHP